MKTQIHKLAVCLGMALTLTVSQVWAGNLTWDGSGNGTWSDPNWWNGTELVQAAGTDDLLFNGRGAIGTINVSGSVAAASGTFTANGYTFSGGTIWLNNVLGVNVAGASGTTTFDSYIRSTGVQFTSAVTANQTLVFNGGGAFNGDIGANTNYTKFGTMILNSGSYALGYYIKIGDITNASTGFIVNAGAIATTGVNNNFWIGYGQNAMVTVNGGLLNIGGNYDLVIGRGNTGRVVVSSGTLLSVATAILNNGVVGKGIDVGFGGGTGILEVKNTGVVQTNYLNIGNNAASGTTANLGTANGTVTVSGGTVNVNTALMFGAGYAGTGGFNPDGSAYTGIATAGTGKLTVSGGVLNIGSGGISDKSDHSDARYTFGSLITLSGGTVGTTGTAGWKSTVGMTLSNADGGVTFNADKDIEISGVVSGGGNFTKAGAGTLLLSGANTYNGDAVITAGALQVDSSLTLGTLTFALDGAATGIASGGGTLNLNAIAFDMTKAGDLGSWDMSSIFDSALTVNFSSGFNISGWTTSDNSLWTSDDGLYSYDLLSKTITAIPEPSALALMLTGVALLALLRRRR